MESRIEHRTYSLTLLILFPFFWIGCENRSAQQQRAPGLKVTYQQSFQIGTAVNHSQIMGEAEQDMELVRRHFNALTPENVMKWERIHPEPQRYDFEAPDKLVAFAEANKMNCYGHTLVWHSQTPKWVFEDDDGQPASRKMLLARMKEHIQTVVGRYRGRIKGWDVVNEAVEDDGSMRETPWFKIIGPDYLEKAFQWAHEADPEAELYYNDYNMWHPGKRETVVHLVRQLLDKGVRIDGIGMQGHWGLDYPTLAELDSSLQTYAELGLNIMITELDMDILPSPWEYQGAEISKRFRAE